MSGLQVTPSAFQVNEGDSLTTSFSGFTPGSTLYFKVVGRGINKKDFAAGGVKGSLKVDANGVATISHSLRADKATEGDESFAIQVFSDKKMRNLLGQSDAVTVFDTSVKAVKGGNGGGKDTITGRWSIGGGDYVTLSVNSNNTPVKTYFGVIEGANGDAFSGYSDSNNNGIFDSGIDAYVGSASLTTYAYNGTGNGGTFTANRTTGSADGYIGNTLVGTAQGLGFWFGRKASNTAPPVKETTAPSKGKDTITGRWSIGGGDYVTLSVNSNNTPVKTYFGVIEGANGDAFSGYSDSNNNGIFDSGIDAYVGSASLTTYAYNGTGNGGTFTANRTTGSADGYIGNTLVGTAQGLGFWFL